MVLTTSQQASTAFLEGSKNLLFLTPPTLNEPSPRKSSSVFIESNGTVQLLPFVQNVVSGGLKLRGALQHPEEALFNFGPRETTMSARYDGTILDHLSEFLLFLSTASWFWFSLDSSYNHEFHISNDWV